MGATAVATMGGVTFTAATAEGGAHPTVSTSPTAVRDAIAVLAGLPTMSKAPVFVGSLGPPNTFF